MKKIVVLSIVCFLFLNSTVSFAESQEPFYMVGDIAIARPVGILATVVGGAIFVVCLPFALTSGSVKGTADTLVGEPFRFTFKRPLGDFRGDVTYLPNDNAEKKPAE